METSEPFYTGCLHQTHKNDSLRQLCDTADLSGVTTAPPEAAGKEAFSLMLNISLIIYFI